MCSGTLNSRFGKSMLTRPSPASCGGRTGPACSNMIGAATRLKARRQVSDAAFVDSSPNDTAVYISLIPADPSVATVARRDSSHLGILGSRYVLAQLSHSVRQSAAEEA